MVDQIAAAEGISLITPGRLENLCAAAWATRELPGRMAELGVFKGGSALVLSGTIPDKTLHLFDTFTGLPFSEGAKHNPTGHDLSQGRFACPENFVRELLDGRNVVFHTGTFPYTAQGLEDLRFAFVHVDCDLYASAAAAIDWFWPRLAGGGILFFDDYGCDFTGVTDAVHERFRDDQVIRQYEPGNGIQIGALVKK